MDVWQESQARAFTVAKAMRVEILEAIREELDRALVEGATLRDFEQALTPRLQALGWWGKQVIVDSEGNAKVAQLGSPRRLETIFRTNLQTAYMAGRYREMMENTGDHPGARNWWMYVAVMDDRTRPAHAALNGRVFRFDDPIWQYIYPPNGFNCRCRVRALSDADLKRLDIQPSSSEGYLSERWAVDPSSGFTERVAVVKLPGMDKPFSPDLGWSYNPGQSSFGTDVAVMRKISAVKDRAVRVQAVQALNNSELRHAEFARWVEEVLANRLPGNDAQVAGFLSEEVADFARAMGDVYPSRVLALPAKRLVHADSPKHQVEGISLSLEEYKTIPAIVASPDAVYWDMEHANLVYVKNLPDGGVIYLPVDPAANVKKVGSIDAMVNAYKLPPGQDGAGRLDNAGRFVKMEK